MEHDVRGRICEKNLHFAHGYLLFRQQKSWEYMTMNSDLRTSVVEKMLRGLPGVKTIAEWSIGLLVLGCVLTSLSLPET